MIHDLLDGIGGYERATPAEGTRTQSLVIAGGKFRECSLTFRPLAAGRGGPDGVDVGKLAGEGKPSTTLLFAALKV